MEGLNFKCVAAAAVTARRAERIAACCSRSTVPARQEGRR